MKKVFLHTLLVGNIALLSACSGTVQNYNLSQEYATSLHYEGTQPGDNALDEDEGDANLVGVPAKSFYGGDLKRGALWWAGKGITLEKGEVFIFHANSIGPDNIPFGATFPPIDLITEEVAIKVTVRAESKVGDSLTLYLQVDDASGYQANAKRPFYKIENSNEFQDYYFIMKDIFIQNEPKKHNVNGALINSLKFFINPGLAPYTGKIFIKEVKIMPLKSIQK